LTIGGLNSYIFFIESPREESCPAVKPGEWYFLVVEGHPCRLAPEIPFLGLATYLVFASPFQIPLLYMGFKVRRKIKLRTTG
jgi:hypothetical protein